jgi:hypothetical protein
VREFHVWRGLKSWERLDLRISASVVAVAGFAPAPVPKAVSANLDDPLPSPEPIPSYPGDEPPIDYPVTPPSGPGGPGS